jgi:uncharacterized protein YwgA
MKTGNFWWVAAVIAAHEQRRVLGRTRLQKTIKLLQRLAFPTDYLFSIFFYGPYSEGLFRDVRLLIDMGLLAETEHSIPDAPAPSFLLQASETAHMSELTRWHGAIRQMEKTETVVLELAATYDAFREMGSNHEDALLRLRHKKASKVNPERESRALELLQQLGLATVS